ncbi:hypothetical protein FOQG_14880 [Fusarium oxysporum f. sp. raphani 54005]|uniref:Uncharacterized protein n=2 Tax=Fusarium oxysporum TaxID=5507 RepID=X0CD70_FUSOX|nr:hypothetical protein FOQG_14880 [Fusarium oxysporum f. sp. raphani 54005]EXM20365.1 hypothetical protein FOTG_11731 [Fusarium oxysporum f. sp. vasinfectum 25433]
MDHLATEGLNLSHRHIYGKAQEFRTDKGVGPNKIKGVEGTSTHTYFGMY